jgi:hypothetical protein
MMAGQVFEQNTGILFLFFISNIKKIKPWGLNWSRGREGEREMHGHGCVMDSVLVEHVELRPGGGVYGGSKGQRAPGIY